MSPRGEIRNLSASVLARLLERSRQTGDEYQMLLANYVSERFLYRLGVSTLRSRFVLKGALLLRVWFEHPYRTTRDVDLLWRGGGSMDAMREDVEGICAANAVPDGIEFVPDSIRLEAIRPEDEYAGTRVTLPALCGKARVPLQVDLGVADAIWPRPKLLVVPGMLDFPPPQVFAYPPESVIAETLEAIVVLGERNSRIKDFFDLAHLAQRLEYDRTTLAEAVHRTFARRHTPVPQEDPVGLTDAYWENPSRPLQIRAFARRTRLAIGPDPGTELLSLLQIFLLPILEDLRLGIGTPGVWPPGGPWRRGTSAVGRGRRDV